MSEYIVISKEDIRWVEKIREVYQKEAQQMLKSVDTIPLPIPRSKEERKLLARTISEGMKFYKSAMCDAVHHARYEENTVNAREQELFDLWVMKLLENVTTDSDSAYLKNRLHEKGYPHDYGSRRRLYLRWIKELVEEDAREKEKYNYALIRYINPETGKLSDNFYIYRYPKGWAIERGWFVLAPVRDNVHFTFGKVEQVSAFRENLTTYKGPTRILLSAGTVTVNLFNHYQDRLKEDSLDNNLDKKLKASLEALTKEL